MDFAKRLLDFGLHAPTTYFPLLIPECLLIEPTETETKEEMDAFVDAMIAIREEALSDPERVKTAPHAMPVKRLDDVKAARDLDLAYAAKIAPTQVTCSVVTAWGHACRYRRPLTLADRGSSATNPARQMNSDK